MTQTMQPGYGPQQYPQGPPQQYQQGAPQPGYGPQGPPQSYPPQSPPPPGPGPQGAPQQGQQVWNQQPQQAPQPPAQQVQETGDDEFFTGGVGGSYMSFSDDKWIGVERGGEIVGISEQQQTDADTKEPMFWPDGRKIMIKIVTMQTNEREDKDDRGLRSAWLPTSRDITKAVHEALKLGSPNEIRLKIGGYLFITRTGSRPTQQKNGGRGFPAFTYTARYIPPQQYPQNDQFFAQGGQQQGPPANGAQQLQQAAAYVASTPNGQPQGAPQQGAPQGPPMQQNNNTPWQQPGAQGQQVNHYAAQQAQAGPPAPQGPPQPQNGQQGWQQPQGGPPPQQMPQQPVYGPQGGQPAPNGYPQGYPQQGPPQQQYPQPGAPQPSYGPQGGQPQGPPNPANPFGQGAAPQQVNQSPYPQGPPPQGQYQQYPQQ